MELFFEFDSNALENDYIEIYRDDEDFDEEEKTEEMWSEIYALFDEIDEFLIKHLGEERVNQLGMDGWLGGKIVNGLTKNECEKLMKYKKDIVGGYIIDMRCSK